MAPGTAPKEMTSASESSSLPILEDCFKSLASKPSAKSASKLIPKSKGSHDVCPLKTEINANDPKKALSSVMIFGNVSNF